MYEPADTLVQFANKVKGSISEVDVRRILNAIICIHLLPAHIKEAARTTRASLRIIRTYTCIECGQSFCSDQDELQWIHTRCPNCVDDEKYCYYGPDESKL